MARSTQPRFITLLSGSVFKAMITAAFLTLLCPTLPAKAQETADKPSSAEDVAIAFYKVGGAKPDVLRWINLSPQYATTPLAQRPVFVEQEQTRLLKKWAAYDPESNLITVKIDTVVTLIHRPGKTKAEDVLGMEMAFAEGKMDYFPYEFGKETYAVIPQNLEKYLRTALPVAQFENMKAVFKNKMVGDAYLYFQLKPIKAETSEPFVLDNHQQWPLMTEVVGVSLMSKDSALLWNYTAPWYISPARKELMNLYVDTDKKEAESDQKASVFQK